MTEFGGLSLKSLRYTLTSPTTATSGNVALSYNPIVVTGRIIGIEIGSPTFAANTGSLYIFASGTTWANPRLVAQINGVAQDRTYYPVVMYQREKTQGAILSGIAYSATEYPVVDGQQIGVCTSGTFGGTSVLAIVYYT